MNNLLNKYKRDIAVRSRIRLDALGAKSRRNSLQILHLNQNQNHVLRSWDLVPVMECFVIYL